MNDERKGKGTWVTSLGSGMNEKSVRRCRISVVEGEGKGISKEFDGERIRIGTRPFNDFVVKDQRVSGSHCEIRLESTGYRLRDLSSTNGTFVAGVRVLDGYVEPGCRIRLGVTVLLFQPLEETTTHALSTRESFGPLVGQSVAMREVFSRLEKLCDSPATVLVLGETGTGKELVAEALHTESSRSKGPFVVVDCGAIPESLIESELFGYEKGAFTGASKTHPGAFERANGGTLFLDEIGELPLVLQPKLLRVLERRKVRRLGGTQSIDLDIRVVAATNRDLAVEINRGRFREDLFYRLAVAHIELPPLRERKEDIPVLIEHLLGKIPGGLKAHVPPEVQVSMQTHPWPGNVRELRNSLERAILLQEYPESSAPTPPETAVDLSVPFKVAKKRLVDSFERQYVSELLKAHDGNVSAAARTAGIDRMSIHKLLNRHDIENPGR